MANVYASTLEGTMKKDVFYSKIRKFKSPLEASVFGDEVTEELFYKVLENANKTYHNYYLEYLDVVKKLMNKEILEVYDLRYPIVKEPSKKYTLDNAFELIYEATKNFGPEYTKIMKKAKEEYQKYQAATISPVEDAYLKTVKMAAKAAKQAGRKNKY